MSQPDLRPAEVALLSDARRAVLATVRADGRPRLVPIAYALDESAGVLYSALDEKPKSVDDPHALGRARDVVVDPHVVVLVDRWSEDWSALGWLRVEGSARLLEADDPAVAAEHAAAIELLRRRYAQYADQHLGRRPVMRIAIERATSWGLR